jgi:hypothetical protein
MPGWGSWDWVGAATAGELSRYLSTVCFDRLPVPDCDVLMVIKHAGVLQAVGQLPRATRLVYCPVDYYGDPSDIEADAGILRRCSRVLVHCERLRRYFEPYAPVEYVDHHVNFVVPPREAYPADGFFLWVGVRSNLGPLVDWVNRHPLPGPLCVLTNLEEPAAVPRPQELGFGNADAVTVLNWSRERQLTLTGVARAALDVKGDDFRGRHKPPAKAIDFIASGLPLAMNPDSSAAEHFMRLGFELASPTDTRRWLSRAYREETCRFGRVLRERLSLEQLGRRYKQIIEDVLAERPT